MDFDFTPAQLEWQREVREFVREAAASYTGRFEVSSEDPDSIWLKMLRERGWLGVGWPTKYGGLGKSAIEQWILLDEIDYAGLPRIGEGIRMIGPAIIAVGSEAMKAEWLPRIVSGEVEFALGYSEPDAGTDLANLKTRAVLDGDEFVINGAKLWNSGGHYATHEWLAVRTDPEAPKREGISIIIVPINSPGITVSPIWTWGGVRTNEVHFDEVRVPAANLVGELNMGWSYIGAALDIERVVIGSAGDLRRHIDELWEFASLPDERGRRPADDPLIRNGLARLSVQLDAARLMSLRNAAMLDAGQIPAAESSMVKVYVTELRVRIAKFATRMLGPWGLVEIDDPMAPFEGEYERLYRDGFHYCFTGGTNEIQRDLIARRGLGLPRQSVGTRGKP